MIVAVNPAGRGETMEAGKAAGEAPYVVGSIERREAVYPMLRVGVLVSGGGTNLQAIWTPWIAVILPMQRYLWGHQQ